MQSHILVQGLNDEQNEQVGRILSAALVAADPREAVRKTLSWHGDFLSVGDQPLDLNQYRRVRVVGVGKAVTAMMRGLLDQLDERVEGGVIISKHVGSAGSGDRLPERVRVLPGGHPVPSAESVESTRALVSFLQEGQPGDLLFCLISGGGSALMTLPYDGISLEDVQGLTRLLLASGADITEMNTLRKHLDQVKGGGLARLAAPAQLVTLILSDVIGSPLDVIASGPTVADSSTYAQALGILRKYGIEEQTPQPVLAHLRRGAAGETAETIKPGDPALEKVTNLLVSSNPQAARAALEQAAREGFHTLLLTTYLQGEAAQAGVVLAGILKEIDASGKPLARPACIVAGGETTVTLHGQGKGGRNQELALGAVALLDGLPHVALVSLATDGEDGPTDAAGAVVTGETFSQAVQQGLDPVTYLQNNDSYVFFDALGALLRPGPTGTNVNDLTFLIAF